MASSNQSKSTRNRRSSAAKGKPSVKKTEETSKAPQNQPRSSMDQKVVARRLAFLPDAKRQAAAKRFAEGESIKSLSEELDLSVTRTAYCLRQELVETSKDADHASVDKTDAEALKAVADEQDIHWAACRAGISTQKAQSLIGSLND